MQKRMNFHVQVHQSVICGDDIQVTNLFPTLRIVRILSGGALWKIGNTTYACQKGDIVLLNNICPRRILKPEEEEPFIIEVYSILPVLLAGKREYSALFYRVKNPVFGSRRVQHINFLLDLISQEQKNGQPDQRLMQLLLESACLFLLRKADLIPEERVSPVQTAVLRMASHIWENIDQTFSIQELAASAGYSETYLKKQFKRIYGMGITDFIRRCRIYRVIISLENGENRNVLDAAFSAGFRSSSGFYKAFQAVTGRKPTDYLKNGGIEYETDYS